MTAVKDFKNNAFLMTIFPKFKKISNKFQKTFKNSKKHRFKDN